MKREHKRDIIWELCNFMVFGSLAALFWALLGLNRVTWFLTMICAGMSLVAAIRFIRTVVFRNGGKRG